MFKAIAKRAKSQWLALKQYFLPYIYSTPLFVIKTTLLASAVAPFGGVMECVDGAESGPEGLAECLVTK